MKSNFRYKDFHFMVGILTLHLYIPESHSLKEKRRVIKPLMQRIQRDFNISISEVGSQDQWQTSVLVCTTASNEAVHTQTIIQKILAKIEKDFLQVQIINHNIEII